MNTEAEREKREENALMLEADLKWLHGIITGRIKSIISSGDYKYEEPEPPVQNNETYYSQFLKKQSVTKDERIVILLAAASAINPEILDDFFLTDARNRQHTIFGGAVSGENTAFHPTVKTALFLLAGNDIKNQLIYYDIFTGPGSLYARRILNGRPGEDGFSKRLSLTDNAISSILTPGDLHYEYSADFPAHELTTDLEWDDLILADATKYEMKELLAWLEHGDRFLADYGKKKNFRPGYRALFYGPPGTGKTLCATLLGRLSHRPVYRVDLSQMVSKYIGETEKNLERIFTMAENRNWILFFDEADALFTKRTRVDSSNDRYANQQTAYLLQKIENCENLVILASNLKGNIDDAFARRFQASIFFPLPDTAERLSLWKGALPVNIKADGDIDLEDTAARYDLAGGSIINVMCYSVLMALAENSGTIRQEHFTEGIKREYAKQGRTL